MDDKKREKSLAKTRVHNRQLDKEIIVEIAVTIMDGKRSRVSSGLIFTERIRITRVLRSG